jgi:Cu(I)/Ag(I) efflux system protein CusF
MKRMLMGLAATAVLATAWADSHQTEAEVRKVDKAAAKITLRHEAIRNLDMPPMSMVFVVRDPAVLDKVKAGDKVLFTAEKDGSQYVVTSIEAKR